MIIIKIQENMDSITIYPKNEKQKFLLKSLLEEMKVRFEMGDFNDTSLLNKKEYFDKIDKSIAQAQNGELKSISKDAQKELLGL